MSYRYSADDIKDMLRYEIEHLVQDIAPGGMLEGVEYSTLNPSRPDNKPGSFKICVRGANIGKWADFATDQRGNDLLSLITHIKCDGDHKMGWKWALAYLGITHDIPLPTQKEQEAAARKREEIKKQRKQDADKRAALMMRLAYETYLEAQQYPVRGSLVSDYLATRGINFNALYDTGRAGGGVRLGEIFFHPKCAWGGKDNRKILPAMIVPFIAINKEGKDYVSGIHRTFLARDGSGKSAEIPTPRLVLGRFAGAAMRLWHGDGDVDKPLILTEGVEDALSVALVCPDHAVWAVGALPNFAQAVLPAVHKSILIFADNDKDEAQKKAIQKAVNTHIKAGRIVRVMHADETIAKDANDLLRAGTQTEVV